MAAAANASCQSVLAVLGHVDTESSALLVLSVLETPQITTCYIALSAGTAGGFSADVSVVTAGAINALACLLDAVALSAQPRLRCVPLLPAAGWTLDRIAALPVQTVLLLPAAHRRLNQHNGPESIDQSQLHQQQQPQQQRRPPGFSADSPQQQQQEQQQGQQQEQQQLLQRTGVTAEDETSGSEVQQAGCSCGGGGDGAWHPPAAEEALVDLLDTARPAHLPRWARRVVTDRVGADSGDGRSSCAPSGSLSANHHNQLEQRRQQQKQQPQAESPVAAPNRCANAHSLEPPPNQCANAHSLEPPPNALTRPLAALPAPLEQQQRQQQQQQQQQQAKPSSSPPQQQQQQHYVTQVDGAPAPPDMPLRFGRVAVGGTFDRLHAGHELLLGATALVAEGFVFVGVTADALLAKKSHRDLLQPYDKRAEEAVSYMRAVRPGLLVESGALSDPKAPTLAELDPDMEALVVSVETLPGAAAINAGRVARGFRPLTIVTVPIIGVRRETRGSSGTQALEADAKAGLASKLSSSGLRAMEAAAAVARGHL